MIIHAIDWDCKCTYIYNVECKNEWTVELTVNINTWCGVFKRSGRNLTDNLTACDGSQRVGFKMYQWYVLCMYGDCIPMVILMPVSDASLWRDWERERERERIYELLFERKVCMQAQI